MIGFAVDTDIVEKCLTVVEQFCDKFNDDIEKQILDLFVLQEEKLKTTSWEVCRGWEKETPARYRNLVNKQGFRKETKRTSGAYWNGDLVRIARRFILPKCRMLIRSIVQEEQRLAATLEEQLNTMRDKVRAELQSTSVKLEPFMRSIGMESKRMRLRIANIFKQLKRRLNTVVEGLTNSDIENRDLSIISQAMNPIYDVIHHIRGMGSTQLRPEMMLRKVTSAGGLWTKVQELARTAFQKVLHDHKYLLITLVRMTTRQIHAHFKAFCQKNAEEDGDERALRLKLVQSISPAKEWLEVMGKELAKCRKYQCQV